MNELKLTENEVIRLMTSAARKGYVAGSGVAGERSLADVTVSINEVVNGLLKTHRICPKTKSE